MRKNLILILAVIVSSLTFCRSGDEEGMLNADIVIYGGTSAAVTAARQAAEMSMTVAVVSPDRHLGGMTSSGLGFTDTGNKEVIGGLARRFYQLVYEHYSKDEAWNWQKRSEYGNSGQGNPAIDGEKRTMWIFEPHVAEEAMEKLIDHKDIIVLRDEWLDRKNGVNLRGGRIISIRTLSGREITGKVFIDATYEGDLMAAAGVSYRTGRESTAEYGEEWNGVQTGDYPIKHHDFDDLKVSPYKIPGDPASGILQGISHDPPGNRGEADKKIQAYCFRLCLTDNPENRIPFIRPVGYDSTHYELLTRIYNKGWRGTFNKFDPIPNRKLDVNNHGPFSFDNIGMNYDYPDASYERRKDIINEHITYQNGLLFFIANDPGVPEEVRAEMSRWGYSGDEFSDNDYWPYNIYVREARRMKGEYVMTENDVLSKRAVPRSIGMGSYNMDSHNVQRYITPEGFTENEGDIEHPTPRPYTIDLGSIMPDRKECKNLLVPVCVSSSHIAYGSIRMEPVFMILGQSAGTLASIACASNKSIYEISYEELGRHLIDDGQVLDYEMK